MNFENYLIKTIEVVESSAYILTELDLTNLKVFKNKFFKVKTQIPLLQG